MSVETGSPLAEHLAQGHYQSYAYAYPHKTAYRAFARPLALREVWAEEDPRALFLYLHVPFCNYRCGFCNLFTRANAAAEAGAAYLDALERQARVAVEQLPAGFDFARLALGGGTPTWLAADELERLFDLVADVLGADPRAIPSGVEASPETATAERLAVLRARGIDRLSLGVQSFVEAEARAAGRPHRAGEVELALERIRAAGFPVLNVDLIYGLPGQTPASWRVSLDAALSFHPEELYLYPLYVRPLTGLEKTGRALPSAAEADPRLALYRQARAYLLDRGYTQVSMRLFRGPAAPELEGPVYCCQRDGMLGLGCGARSYTRGLHYSFEYAVGARGVREILQAYLASGATEFAQVAYGYRLDEEDQRRRFVIQGLLQAGGLDLGDYRRRFGSEALGDLPELSELEPSGLVERQGAVLAPTPLGLEWSDALGPWLRSARVRALSAEYELR